MSAVRIGGKLRHLLEPFTSRSFGRHGRSAWRDDMVPKKLVSGIDCGRGGVAAGVPGGCRRLAGLASH